MTTGPIQSTRVGAPPPTVDTLAPPASNSSSGRHSGALEGPPDLHSRPPSARMSNAGESGQRIRQPLPTGGAASPEHDGGALLTSGERSDRFSALEHERYLSSGPLTSAESHVGLELSDIGSEDIRRAAPVERPRQPGGLQVQAPPPGRSWSSVAGALVAGLRQAGTAIANEAAVTLGVVHLPRIPRRLVGALAGHSIHQSIAVGMPTFVREMVAAGFMHAMRAQPKSVAVGVQVTMGLANLGIQLLREYRELRNPDEAARAYFSLSADEWAAKPPEEQAGMRLHHRRMSRAITSLQVLSSVANLSMMIAHFDALDPAKHPDFAGHDHTAALLPLGNEIKVGVYAVMRDGVQATFNMVGYTPSPTALPGQEFAAGLRGAAHAASAATYASANSAMSFLSDALMGAWVPDRGTAVATLMGDPSTGMGHAHAWLEVAKGASVSALTNTLAETIDWFQRMQHFVNQTGATQHWGPRLTGTDYGRLLDQAPARAAAFNAIFSVLTLAGGEMAKSDLPPPVQKFIGNVGLGVMIAMLDSPISGIWQAEEAVRAQPTPRSTVTITELEEGQGGEPHSPRA